MAGLPDPVVRRAELIGGDDSAGQGRHDRDPRRRVGHGGRHRAELGEHGVHVRGVEGVADPQPACLASVALPVVGDVEYRVLGAGDNHGLRSVDRGEAYPVFPAGQHGQHLLLGRLHRDHQAAGREVLHQPAAGGHQSGGVRQGEHAGRVRRGQFADGVAEQVVRAQSPGAEQPVQGHLEREQAGLRVQRLVQQVPLRGAVAGEEDLPQRTVQVDVELLAHLVQRLGEHREAPVQLLSHTWTLGALAGEEEGAAALPGHPADDVRPGKVIGQRVQPAQKLVAVGGQDHRPVRQRGPCRRQRVREVRKRVTGAAVEVCAQPPCLTPQRRLAAGRDHEGQRISVGR